MKKVIEYIRNFFLNQVNKKNQNFAFQKLQVTAKYTHCYRRKFRQYQTVQMTINNCTFGNKQ